jgi:hypothetical protein
MIGHPRLPVVIGTSGDALWMGNLVGDFDREGVRD